MDRPAVNALAKYFLSFTLVSRSLTVATDKGQDVLEASSVNIAVLDAADKALGEHAKVSDLLGGAED